jgi:Flp pilus assembly protein TadG
MRRSNERGVSAVEFALLLPLFLLILFGIIEFSFILYDQQLISNASRSGARTGILATTPRPVISDIETAVYQSLQDSNGNWLLITFASKQPPDVSVPTGACTASNVPSTGLTVTVSYPYNFLMLGKASFGGIANPVLTASTTMRCE